MLWEAKAEAGERKQRPVCGGCLGHGNSRVRRTVTSVFFLLLLLTFCGVPSRAAKPQSQAPNLPNATDAGGADDGVCGRGPTRDAPRGSECDATRFETEATASEERLSELLRQGTAAFRAEEFAEASALLDRLSREAGVLRATWDQMSLVHKLNGMALARLGDGVRALWCFKNAMRLATQQSKRPRLPPESQKALAQFTQQLQYTVMETGKNFYVMAKLGLESGRPDPGLLYTAAQYAVVVGKKEEAERMLDALASLRPGHGGVLLQRGLLARDRKEDDRALRLLRAAARREQLPHDASALWQGLASLECERDETADTCAEAWHRSFETEVGLVPMNADSAYQAAVSYGNLLLKTVRGDNAADVLEAVAAFGRRAARLGLLNAPLQLPEKLVRGVSFAPYRDDAATWRVVRHLEDNFAAIRDEVRAADADGRLREMARFDYESLHTAGEWRELNVVAHGIVNEPAVALLPVTSRVVFQIRDALSMVVGGSKISLMQPGTVVRPHTGSTNSRLRIHLGIIIPPGPRLKVGNETRTWAEGRCTVIEDSYVHEVWHGGDERRIVLIVDVWHPEMDARMREDSLADAQALGLYQKWAGDPAGELRRQGVKEELVPSRFISDARHLDDGLEV